MFVPFLLVCQLAEPQMCQPVYGNPFATEQECVIDAAINGTAYVAQTYPDFYIAGVACMEVSFLDQPT